MSRILIVDDEARIRSFLERGLRDAGYATTTASDGAQALAHLKQTPFDLVLLDIGLPGIDGTEVLRRLRASGDTTAVILVTARGTLDDIVDGLDAGADDYIAKPYRLDEVLARVRARLREPGSRSGVELEHGDLVLDLRTRRVRVPHGEWDLSAREFSLLESFLRHPGQVLTRAQLMSGVWGIDFDAGSNVVDVYVGYLRGKIGPARIQTVRGAGYRLV